jgi:uncharacterized RDD family membrane protein YckC
VSDTHDPYRAPASDLHESHAPLAERELAGPWRRFGNLLVDTFGAYLLHNLVVVGIVYAVGVPAMLDLGAWLLLVLFGNWVAYYVFFEALFARTPGKWITGTQVVDADGGPPDFWQVVGRSLARLVPFEAFSFLGERQGFHDAAANTFVVRVAPKP